jgi:uncharacterized cupredoxin-like copper-binding protein
MATTIDKTPTVEEELQHLEAEENELENRASSLEMKTILLALIAGVALVFSIAALAVALIERGNNGTSGTMMRSTGAASGAAAGMMNGSAANANASAPVVNGAHVITAQLGEMWVRPSATSVPAGKVTFRATNVGNLTHELMVERMPIRFDSPMHPTESAALGMIDDMDPGKSGQMTVTLKPGQYMLFCNVPGHYAAGQHTILTVTQS